jgi:hypothetical protein
MHSSGPYLTALGSSQSQDQDFKGDVLPLSDGFQPVGGFGAPSAPRFMVGYIDQHSLPTIGIAIRMSSVSRGATPASLIFSFVVFVCLYPKSFENYSFSEDSQFHF